MQKQVANELVQELSPTPTTVVVLSAGAQPEACLLISVPSSHQTEKTRLGPYRLLTVINQPLPVGGDSQHLQFPPT